jgi:hypothetical protein
VRRANQLERPAGIEPATTCLEGTRSPLKTGLIVDPLDSEIGVRSGWIQRFAAASRSPIRSAGLNRSWARAAFSASYVAEYRPTIARVLCSNTYHTYSSLASFSMAQVARRHSGSKRAWKKRRYFGSYTMRSPRISFRRAWTAHAVSAVTSM